MEYRKFVRKDNKQYKNGYLVTGKGKIRQPEPSVVCDLNLIEALVQEASQIIDAADANELVEVMRPDKKFKRASEFDNPFEAKPRTPLLDEKREQAKQLMQEIDDVNRAEVSNKLLNYFKAAFNFVANDSYVSSPTATQFDLPILGNPLELDGPTLCNAIDLIAQAHEKSGYLKNHNFFRDSCDISCDIDGEF